MLNIQAIQIARPYAKAAFEYAEGAKVVEAWQKLLAKAASIIENETIQSTLMNPKVTEDVVCDMVVSLCDDVLDEEGKRLFKLMAHYRRLSFIPAVSALFSQYKEQAEQEIQVELTSPFDISKAHQASLKDLLSKKLDRQIKLSCEKDASLVGGVVVRAGDLVIDDSVKGRLHRLATELKVEVS